MVFESFGTQGRHHKLMPPPLVASSLKFQLFGASGLARDPPGSPIWGSQAPPGPPRHLKIRVQRAVGLAKRIKYIGVCGGR